MFGCAETALVEEENPRAKFGTNPKIKGKIHPGTRQCGGNCAVGRDPSIILRRHLLRHLRLSIESLLGLRRIARYTDVTDMVSVEGLLLGCLVLFRF